MFLLEAAGAFPDVAGAVGFVAEGDEFGLDISDGGAVAEEAFLDELDDGVGELGLSGAWGGVQFHAEGK